MATVRSLRKGAPALLEISKLAFKFIRDNPSGDEHERSRLLERMIQVIDKVDPPTLDEDLISIRLAMTNATANAIFETFEERASAFPEDREVLDALHAGTHRTKQRAFIRLDLDNQILRRLRYVLLHTKANYQEKPFKRLAKQIDEELKEKNPMEILGKMAL
jgi:hypothetical protein